MPVLHDYIEHTDGGSRLCIILANALHIPLISAFVHKQHPFLQGDPHEAPEIQDLCPPLCKAPLAVPLLRQYIIAQLFARRTHALLAHKTYAIYSGAYAPLAVHNTHSCKNILYCHTPPRFLYDQHQLFTHMVPKALRCFFTAFCHWLKPRYEAAVKSMDIIVANSAAVQERIRGHLHLPSSIVYPPCDVQTYTHEPSQGYFLSMVRLDKLKRLDLLINAFRELPQEKLLIASTGPEEALLKSMAARMPNITFVGVLSEEKRRTLLARCRATLCVAKSEDFGMCAVESLAAGKPVIIAKAGGLQEIIQHGETGLCVSADPSPQEIATAVAHMQDDVAAHMRRACEERATHYDTQHFITKIQSLIG